MVWNCSSCKARNDNDAQATCSKCKAIRVLECPTCHRDIRYGPRLNVGGKVFHPDCFTCAACHKKLPSRFQVKDGEYYHFECYKTLFHPRCAVCEDFIPYVPGTTRISFKVMPYWDLKFCPKHDDNDRCCSCQRVEASLMPTVQGKQFHELSDGRKVCHDCCDTVVLDTHEAQDVVKEVWAFMESMGFRNPEVPMYLVESPVLNKHCSLRKQGSITQMDNRPVLSHVTRGMCLSEVSRIQHMVRHGQDPKPQVVSIETNRSVNAILVLHGLPFDLTASVLAHEATHAFIKLHDFPEKIPQPTEEGVCQLMSYLYLKYKHMVDDEGTKKRTFHAKLREFYLHQIETDPTPVYGDGFRAALEAYNNTNSLQKVFDGIRHHGSFP